ncbi:autophagy-related protein 17 [Myxozyma melibiosi]|uniref:Autophagy-related protein 17 n=1 Tax=Myxozyma melibiosi TaxID=54550 RepID=A0ABR1F392_9ASCO
MESDWFINAKQALAAAEPICTAADSLVVCSRETLEAALAVHSKSLFLDKELHSQIALLYQINEALHAAVASCEAEFEASLLELDKSGARLDGVLTKLQELVVDPAFKSSSSTEDNQEGDGDGDGNTITTANTKRTLKDYTHDAGVEQIKSQLRQAIDVFQDQHGLMISGLSDFDIELADLSEKISEAPPPLSDISQCKSFVNSLEIIETHARDMGILLESLAHHYDQCSQALMTSDESRLEDDPERADLIAVLRDDAAQVPDVLDEIRERHAAMSALTDALTTFLSDSTERYTSAVQRSSVFSAYKQNLERHLLSAREFADGVQDYFDRRNSLLSELEELIGYFEGFIRSYDALVLEVVRRQNTKKRMESVVHETLDKLKAIYDEEMDSRTAFWKRSGPYIPIDLWPGVSDPPIGFEIVAHEVSPLPELGRTLIEQAKRRLVSKDGGF